MIDSSYRQAPGDNKLRKDRFESRPTHQLKYVRLTTHFTAAERPRTSFQKNVGFPIHLKCVRKGGV